MYEWTFFDYFFVSAITVFVLGTIITGSILLYKLKQRKTILATVFLKSGGLRKFWFDRDKNVAKTELGTAYVLDERAVYKTRYRDYLFYTEGNPNPLLIDAENHKAIISSYELKGILDQDLLEKLFGQGMMKTMQMLIIITLLCGVITMFCVFFLLFGKVQVKDTPELRQLIYNVTRSAIMGQPI